MELNVQLLKDSVFNKKRWKRTRNFAISIFGRALSYVSRFLLHELVLRFGNSW